MRLLVSAGGTGGGVYPALAVVAAIGPKTEVLWVGGIGGMEASLVARAGLTFEAVPAAGVHGVGVRQLPVNVVRLAQGTFAARRVLNRFRPDVMLFTGGYVGVPVALAGGNVPTVAFVPDIEPGLALRLITRLADVVALSVSDAKRFYPGGKRLLVTGYPTRPELKPMPKVEARAAFGLEPGFPVILVLGGSRGARSINRAVWACLPSLLGLAQVIHITGELDWPDAQPAQAGLAAQAADRYHPSAYLHETIGVAMASADLAISRAGASTLGELPLFGLPAILVPYPHAWRYQKVNADYLVRHGAATILNDEELPTRLLPSVNDLLADPGRLEAMASSARRLATPGAASAIAAEVEALGKRLGGGHG